MNNNRIDPNTLGEAITQTQFASVRLCLKKSEFMQMSLLSL